jgi:hypothetical protein
VCEKLGNSLSKLLLTPPGGCITPSCTTGN